MIISTERLDALSAQTGFAGPTIERVARLLDVLEGVARDPFLGERFALKGGTALNLFHMNVDRLSVDIDLNYVGSADRNVMLDEKGKAEKRIVALMQRLGYGGRRMPIEHHAGGKWIFTYKSAHERNGTLEVDLNYMYRVPFFGTTIMDSHPLGPYVARGIQVVDINEIAAGKIVALVDRRASRDLYDTQRLLERNDLDWAKVKVATLAIGAASRDGDWREANLDRYVSDPKEIRSKLTSMLRPGVLDPAQIEQWSADTLGICRAGLERMFTFTTGERAFLDAIYDEGRIDTSTLDVDVEIKERISLFPALRWKAQNVADHVAKKGVTHTI